jgi:hypothetical protein
MRILYIIQEYPLISQTYTKVELERVVRHHEVRIVAYDKAHVPYKRHQPFTLLDKSKPITVGDFVGGFAPDRLHAHHIVTAPTVAQVARALGVPFTIRAHSFDVLEGHLGSRPEIVPALNHPLCRGVLCFPFTVPILRQAGVAAAKLVPCWPVVDVKLFADRRPNGDRIMNVGACIPKKGMGQYLQLACRVPDLRFDLYALGYMADEMRQRNEALGSPLRFVDPVEPEAMPAEYKEHRWLVYTASPQYRSVGWPMAIAEAQAAGVGVLMQNVRPDLAEYVGPGFLFDHFEEVERLIRGPVPEDRREAGFVHAMRSDVDGHIGLLYDLWQ